jgi:uncharacterized protein (TIGR02231 family)
MKKIIGWISILLISLSAGATEKEIIKSTISEVTVYAQGAQIFRKANFTVKPGVTEVIIEGVCAQIDANSLQVKASGNVIILDSKFSLFYPKPEEVNLEGLPLKVKKDIQALEDSLRTLNFDIQELQDEIDVLNASKNILANNGAVRGQGKVNDSINLLKQTIDYYSVKMLELNKRLLTLNKKKTYKLDTKKGMEDRLRKLKNFQSDANLLPKNTGPIPRITITLSSKETVSGKFSVSYLVANAGWTPLYDLRSEISTGKINLNYKAQVYQNTGVDWEDVRLNISTNNPYQNKTKPTLHPWYIDYNMYKSNNQQLGYNSNYGRNDKEKSAPTMMNKKAEAYGFAEEDANSVDYNSISSTQFVQVIQHMISAEFRIDLPYSIQSNNEQHMVLVKNVDVPANFIYYTVPKLDNSVYLVAQLSKLDELQLVPAKANIFFDGSYIGETYIDPSNMEDTLNLSLGRDPNIMVKRSLLKKDCKEKVVGNQIEKTYAYFIEAKNFKGVSIDIIIQDQLPITQNTEIQIEALELGKGKLNEKTGTIEWKYTIKPKESKTIDFQYKVKHNKDTPLPL